MKCEQKDISEEYPIAYNKVDALVEKFLNDLTKIALGEGLYTLPLGNYMQTDAEDYDEYQWILKVEEYNWRMSFSLDAGIVAQINGLTFTPRQK